MEKNFASSLRLVCKTNGAKYFYGRDEKGLGLLGDSTKASLVFFSTATIAHLLSHFVLLAKCLEQVRKEIGGISKDLN